MQVQFNLKASQEILGLSNSFVDWNSLTTKQQQTFLREFNMGGCDVIFSQSDLRLLKGLKSIYNNQIIDFSDYVLDGNFIHVITREGRFDQTKVVYLEGVPANSAESYRTVTLYTVYMTSFIEAMEKMVKIEE